MKIITAILTATFFAQNLFASPLIFKAFKEIKAGETVELGTVDCKNYKQIRFTLVVENAAQPSSSIALIEIQLRSAEREFKRAEELLGSGIISRAEYDRAQSTLNERRKELETAKAVPIITISAIEGLDFIPMQIFDAGNKWQIIDSPPSKLQFKVAGAGSFKLFVWGSL